MDELNRILHARNAIGRFRKAVEERDRGICASCGADRKHWVGLRWEIHHRIAVADGGTTTLDNLITMCHLCHQIETNKRRAS